MSRKKGIHYSASKKAQVPNRDDQKSCDYQIVVNPNAFPISQFMEHLQITVITYDCLVPV